MSKKLGLQAFIEVAIMAGLALVLDVFIPSIKPIPSISISFAMVPIFVIAFRRGVIAGFLSGFLWGTLQVILGDAWVVHPVQVVMEYFVAFAFIGFAGMFRSKIQKFYREGNTKLRIRYVILAIFIGSLARYFWHFIAGFIFWAEAGSTLTAAISYSLYANGITAIGAAILCSIILLAVFEAAPRILTQSIKDY